LNLINPSPIPIITIEGATASGKSELAIELALRLGTEIISADSRQVYQGLDIGTAKVDKHSQDLVKHHLINIIDPLQSYNAGQFSQDAYIIARNLHLENRIPIFCGGTGLYIRSALLGLFQHPPIPDEIRKNLLARLEESGLEELYRELILFDPDFAAKISSNDKQRILRGLEVYQATGIPISIHWKNQHSTPVYQPFRILISEKREILYERINARVTRMLKQGLLDEITSLLNMGYDFSCPALNTLGYKEFRSWFESSTSLKDCSELVCQHTRNYAKRQCTWYRKYIFDLEYNQTEFLKNISKIIDFIRAST